MLLIVLEQFQRALPEHVATYVKELTQGSYLLASGLPLTADSDTDERILCWGIGSTVLPFIHTSGVFGV